MKFVALISGGKDSVYNIMECVAHGHKLVALANLSPPKHLHDKRLLYDECHNDEVEDLYELLSRVLCEHSDVTAVSSGAILSDYQRYRVENVTHRLGLRSLCFLWQRSQEELLEDMISAHIEAIIIKIASFGLTIDDFLGFRLNDVATKLFKLSVPPWSLNVCGEGGEFETTTLDCPMFRSRISLASEPELVIHSKDPFSPTAYLRLKNLILEAKPSDEVYYTSEQLLSLEGKCINNQGNNHTSARRPFISPLDRLKEIQLKTCEEIRNDIICTQLNTSGSLSITSDDNTQKCNEVNLKSLNDFARCLGSEIWLTSNFIGTSEKSDKIDEATENAFHQMKNMFDSSGIEPQQILQFIVVLSQPLSADVFSVFNQAYTVQLNEWFDEKSKNHITHKSKPVTSYLPARVCISMNSFSQEINVHSREGCRISLSAIICHGKSDMYEWINSLRGLYVQSISHWAPANIGPYSQAIGVPTLCSHSENCTSSCGLEQFTFYSGQIGLIPELEVLPSQTGHFSRITEALETESWLAIRHCHRIMKCMSPSKIWTNLFIGICYAVDEDSLIQARKHFHLSVCSVISDSKHISSMCDCNKCIVWIIVSGLPKNASVEWQWITGPSASLVTSVDDTINNGSFVPQNTFMLFYRYDYYQSNQKILLELLSAYKGFVLPVIKFADPNVNTVFVSVHNK
ncbi:unnamed protein product [Trichobilharzia regenti]|nr:unnamed protein product [Trichobilharzia regenti]